MQKNGMKQPLISVIIPVYNGAKTVGKAIKSVLNQTYTNFELLIIDDGSKDNSLDICQQFARKDPRIRLVHKENEGIMQTRWQAIGMATGDYLAWLDSDDWFARGALEKMITAALAHNADLVCAGAYKVLDKWGLLKTPMYKNEDKFYAQNHLEKYHKVYIHGLIPYSVWDKLYKRSLFNNVDFKPLNISFAEDMYLNMLVSPNITSICFISDYVYYYRFGGGTCDYNPNFWTAHYAAYWEEKAYLERYNPTACSNLAAYMLRVFYAAIDLRVHLAKKKQQEVECFCQSVFASAIFADFKKRLETKQQLTAFEKLVLAQDARQCYQYVKERPNKPLLLKHKVYCFLAKMLN